MVKQPFPPAKVKDLGIKIGTPEQVMWQNVLDAAKEMLKGAEETKLIQIEVIKMATLKIEEEKKKLK